MPVSVCTGVVEVAEVQLCSMFGPKQPDGYYEVCAWQLKSMTCAVCLRQGQVVSTLSCLPGAARCASWGSQLAIHITAIFRVALHCLTFVWPAMLCPLAGGRRIAAGAGSRAITAGNRAIIGASWSRAHITYCGAAGRCSHWHAAASHPSPFVWQ